MKRIQYQYYIILVVTLTGFMSCNRNKLKVDISGIEREVEIVRFEQELFSVQLKDTLKEMAALHDKHPEFFDLFTWKVINAGGLSEEYFPRIMGQFLTDSMILDVKNSVEKEFSDFKQLHVELVKAYKYYQYHFPSRDLPVLYTMISGFNQSVVTAEDLIGISLDKYLGRNYSYYQQLSNIPLYKIKNMHRDKIPSDVVYAWGMTEFDDSRHITTLLDHLIFQGKLMYFVDALLPEVHDSLKIGYTAEQLDWCRNNEPQMWNHLVENRLLFTNKRMEILRFINDGPYTTGFPIESPARSGIWIGWQIVRQYMRKFDEVTLPELMANQNYQQILNDSEYFPD